jgi:hypothetical protein
MDWHHRRNSLVMYWRQQKGYGKAEALLEEKWPERYNTAGHVAWAGRLYGRGFALPIPFGRSRVYGGVWGSAGYQSLYAPAPPTLLSLPLMPEWYFLIAALAALALLGLSWPPLLWAAPLLALAIAPPIAQAGLAATRAHFPVPAQSAAEKAQRWVLTFGMHLIQPLARLVGRLRQGLTPWRRRGSPDLAAPWPRHDTIWSETWRAPEAWAERLESSLRQHGAVVTRGGDFDRWDLHARGGLFGGVIGHLAVEEHGAGKQFLRLGTRPRVAWPIAGIVVGSVLLGGFACAAEAWAAGGALFAVALSAGAFAARDCAQAAGCWIRAAKTMRADGSPLG